MCQYECRCNALIDVGVERCGRSGKGWACSSVDLVCVLSRRTAGASIVCVAPLLGTCDSCTRLSLVMCIFSWEGPKVTPNPVFDFRF